VSHISTLFTLEDGDLILTGTPAGVGPVLPGQTIEAAIEGGKTYSWRVEAENVKAHL
jgi:2-keto-4-pentenoate hydratase/2-oxohepta-3-ene-1,7-dioic acid hydratase in catechol pathway